VHWETARKFYTEAERAARLSGQVQKMLAYGEKALEIARKTGNPALELGAINEMIFVHTYLRD
jgi:hypothetical protein